MDQIYQIRETIIAFYKSKEKIIFPIIKFLTWFIIFQFISIMGYAKSLTSIPIGILFGIICTIISVQWVFLLIILLVTTHLVFVSVETAILIFAFLLIIYLLYIRLFPKQSLLIIAMLLAYFFKIPYLVPIFGGLFLGVSSIIPIAIGTIIWYFIPNIQTVVGMKSEEIMEMPNNLANIYMTIIQGIAKNQTAIISIMIFSIVILVVYIISKLSIDYSWYIAIGIGAGINLIGFLIGILIVDAEINIFGMLFSIIISMLIMFVIQFFYRVVNYSRVENVQFEDEENYYYVKVIPKIILEKPKREIKRIIED